METLLAQQKAAQDYKDSIPLSIQEESIEEVVRIWKTKSVVQHMPLPNGQSLNTDQPTYRPEFQVSIGIRTFSPKTEEELRRILNKVFY